MRIFGIGIDVVEVSRISQAIERQGERFLEKIFTPGERAYCESQKNSAQSYAARFAAKEAVSKALGTGIGREVGWQDLEIIRLPSGAPSLTLRGAAAIYARRHDISEVQISLTHARDYAAANALALVGESIL